MLLLNQTLGQAILWYVCAFVFTCLFIVAGCLLGAFARKKKNMKLAKNAEAENVNDNDATEVAE